MMESVMALFTGESGSGIQLISLTAALAVLLILIFWIVRMIAGSGGPRGVRGRMRRLYVTDSAKVDDKRFLVLLRRDNVEHLVLIGGPTDVVVEQNIKRIEGIEPVSASMERANAMAEPETAEPQPAPKAEMQAEPAKATAMEKAPTPQPTKDETPTIKDTVSASVAPVANSAMAMGAGVAAMGASAVAATTDAVQTSTEAVAEAVDPATKAIEQALSNLGNEDMETAEPHIAPPQQANTVQAATAAPSIEAPEQPAIATAQEIDPLEDEILSQLDEAMAAESIEAPKADPIVDMTVEAQAPKESSADDEMQRLLKELAGEEPVKT